MTAIPTPTSSVRPGEPPWNRLGRPVLGALSTPVVGGLAAAATFGLLPAVAWPLRWAAAVDRERPFYRDLIAWWRTRVDAAHTGPLDAAAAVLRPRPMLVVLPWVAALTAAAALATGLALDGPRHVLTITYKWHDPRTPDGWPGPHDVWHHLHAAWVWGLAVAYGLHWYAVRSHARAVGELTRWVNRQAREHGLPMVRNVVRPAVSVPWVGVAGVLCLASGAWWAIPLAMAGAARRRYAERSTPRLQRELSGQASDVDARTRSPRVEPGRFCASQACGALLPSAARFCNRCGTAVVADPYA